MTNAPSFGFFGVVGFTRQQRVFVAILGLAGTALLIDRVILGGATSPASASASQDPSSPASVARPASAAPSSPETPDAKSLAARRLAALDVGVEMEGADAFVPPASWAPPAGRGEPSAAGVESSENAMISGLRLTAVMTSGRPAARINDRLIVVGMKTPEGVELVAVGERSATVRLPSGSEVTLELSLPGTPTPHR